MQSWLVFISELNEKQKYCKNFSGTSNFRQLLTWNWTCLGKSITVWLSDDFANVLKSAIHLQFPGRCTTEELCFSLFAFQKGHDMANQFNGVKGSNWFKSTAFLLSSLLLPIFMTSLIVPSLWELLWVKLRFCPHQRSWKQKFKPSLAFHTCCAVVMLCNAIFQIFTACIFLHFEEQKLKIVIVAMWYYDPPLFCFNLRTTVSK